jgi:gluconate:H+ symporter, GntP family
VLVAGRTYIDPGQTLEGGAHAGASTPSNSTVPSPSVMQTPVPPSRPPDSESPPAALALAPIVLPLVLIVLQSVAQFPSRPLGKGLTAQAVAFLGQPVVALLLGVAASLLLPRRLNRRMLSAEGWVGKAIAEAAPIIFITCAGGAFGKVLQNSDIARSLGGAMAHWPLGIWLPFVIAAAIKTVQGSSTVAMMTTAGIMLPLLGLLSLEGVSARALVVVAIGAGSMVVSHVNDSYFWVVTRFSHMSITDGYRLQTLGTLIEGAVAAVAVWVLSLVVL